MTKKRYWTQFGYTPQEAFGGWGSTTQKITTNMLVISGFMLMAFALIIKK